MPVRAKNNYALQNIYRFYRQSNIKAVLYAKLKKLARFYIKYAFRPKFFIIFEFLANFYYFIKNITGNLLIPYIPYYFIAFFVLLFVNLHIKLQFLPL